MKSKRFTALAALLSVSICAGCGLYSNVGGDPVLTETTVSTTTTAPQTDTTAALTTTETTAPQEDTAAVLA